MNPLEAAVPKSWRKAEKEKENTKKRRGDQPPPSYRRYCHRRVADAAADVADAATAETLPPGTLFAAAEPQKSKGR